MRTHTGIGLAIAIALLTGCASGIDGANYTQQQPRFDLFEFFDGQVTAWGVVQDRQGNVIQRFQVDIVGSRSEQTLTLDEHFEYGLGDGVTERVWQIDRDSSGGYTGRAGDIVGTAEGTAYGNAFQWRYEMDLPVGESSYRVSFDDWFWAVGDEVLVNRSYIRKFGLTFAEVTIFMQKQGALPRSP